MNYCQFQPHLLLRNLVECYWIVEGSDTASHKIVGDGFPELIFHFGDPYTIGKEINEVKQQQPLTIAAGQLTRPIFLKPTGKSGVFGVKFHPTGFWKFFCTNMALLHNQTLNLADVVSDDYQSIPDELKRAPSNEERIAIIENILFKKLQHIRTSEADQFIDYIKKYDGRVSVTEMCARHHFSSRKLQRLFNEQVGISAKQYAKQIRFNRVYSLLQQRELSKTDITYLCGFFDQAHFNKEFKFFSGQDPGTWLSQNHEFSDFFMNR